jgi:SAM-dependent methyltransferase
MPRALHSLRTVPGVDGADELLAEAAARGMSGWDFTWLDGRMTSDGLPWDYASLVEAHAATASAVLDMGTGGGEVLSAIHALPRCTVATEGWRPNVPVAARRLAPLGIAVVHDEGAVDNFEQQDRDARGRLPFRDEAFDLVINRHEAFTAAEVHRVLQPHGHFLTQQAGSGGADAGRLLGEPVALETFDRAFASCQLRAAGFDVLDGASAVETMTFADVGAFAWYLTVIPWMVPAFSIKTHRSALRELHQSATVLEIHATRFWLVARRAAA